MMNWAATRRWFCPAQRERGKITCRNRSLDGPQYVRRCWRLARGAGSAGPRVHPGEQRRWRLVRSAEPSRIGERAGGTRHLALVGRRVVIRRRLARFVVVFVDAIVVRVWRYAGSHVQRRRPVS